MFYLIILLNACHVLDLLIVSGELASANIAASVYKLVRMDVQFCIEKKETNVVLFIILVVTQLLPTY